MFSKIQSHVALDFERGHCRDALTIEDNFVGAIFFGDNYFSSTLFSGGFEKACYMLGFFLLTVVSWTTMMQWILTPIGEGGTTFSMEGNCSLTIVDRVATRPLVNLLPIHGREKLMLLGLCIFSLAPINISSFCFYKPYTSTPL